MHINVFGNVSSVGNTRGMFSLVCTAGVLVERKLLYVQKVGGSLLSDGAGRTTSTSPSSAVFGTMSKETSLVFFLRRPIHPSFHATNLINPVLYKHNTGSSAFSYPTLRPGIFFVSYTAPLLSAVDNSSYICISSTQARMLLSNTLIYRTGGILYRALCVDTELGKSIFCLLQLNCISLRKYRI